MRYLDFAHVTTRTTERRSERLVIAIDASPSMENEDWSPSRLIAAIEAAIALIMRKCQIAPDDCVGVVAYASSAWWVAKPIAVGHGQDRLCRVLRKISTGCSTNITAALATAGQSLLPPKRRPLLDRLLPPSAPAESVEETQRIILLTDGDFNAGGNPKNTARQLKDAGVSIDCVGIGGSPSDVNEDPLRSIASAQADGVTPRYAFIGDKQNLIEKFEQLAGRITR